MATRVKTDAKILVTGAAGTVGVRLVQRLLAAGHRVRGLVLPADPLRDRLAGLDCEIAEGDITRPASLAAAVAGVDTVYHLAAVVLSHDPALFSQVNVQGTRNLLDAAAAAGVQHFVYISSASVVYPHSTPYSRSKRAAEQLVREQRAMHHTIVRPTLVYERGGGQEFMLFLDYLKRFPVVPFIGDGRALKNPVHVDDLIAGLAAIAGNRKSHGKIYNLCGGEEISIEELARLMLEHSGAQRPLIHLPTRLCQAIAIGMKLLTKNPPLTLNAIAGVTQHANLDPGDARQDLDYRPIGVRQGLAQCLAPPGRDATK